METLYYFSPTETAASVAEFLAACRANKAVARDHLAAGYFEPWLRDQGRNDLASRAAKVRGQEDGLELFLKTARPTPRSRKAA
jgi:hypothetical protein